MMNQDPSPVAPARSPDDPARIDPEPSDQDLLKRYVDLRDEAAFAALVHRYGPLVLGACRRVLGHEQDSEDAFQATFLVLARKAGAITKGASMGGWLYRVAYRIARKLKGRQARRQCREREAQEFAAAEETPDWVWREVRALLDEEVNRLPDKYRLPFILCYLNGKTNEEAARQLVCPVGTLASRLAWARERLRARLTHRGVVLSAAVLATGLTAQAGPVAVAGALAEATARAGLRFGAGQGLTPETVPARLAREYLRRTFRGWLLLGTAGVVILVVVAVVVWFPRWQRGGRPDDQPSGNGRAVSAREDLAKFQGTWKVEELEAGGQKRDPQGVRMVFTDHTARLEAGGQALLMTFELVPSGKPKMINLMLTGLGPGDVPAPGIYALDGDVLRICYTTGGPGRPTAFTTHPNTSELLYVLRRE
jgi:RNA polymerase sigma factor (sigma-70 family)